MKFVNGDWRFAARGMLTLRSGLKYEFNANVVPGHFEAVKEFNGTITYPKPHKYQTYKGAMRVAILENKARLCFQPGGMLVWNNYESYTFDKDAVPGNFEKGIEFKGVVTYKHNHEWYKKYEGVLRVLDGRWSLQPNGTLFFKDGRVFKFDQHYIPGGVENEGKFQGVVEYPDLHRYKTYEGVMKFFDGRWCPTAGGTLTFKDERVFTFGPGTVPGDFEYGNTFHGIVKYPSTWRNYKTYEGEMKFLEGDWRFTARGNWIFTARGKVTLTGGLIVTFSSQENYRPGDFEYRRTFLDLNILYPQRNYFYRGTCKRFFGSGWEFTAGGNFVFNDGTTVILDPSKRNGDLTSLTGDAVRSPGLNSFESGQVFPCRIDYPQASPYEKYLGECKYAAGKVLRHGFGTTTYKPGELGLYKIYTGNYQSDSYTGNLDRCDILPLGSSIPDVLPQQSNNAHGSVVSSAAAAGPSNADSAAPADSEGFCAVCLVERANMAFFPCRHVVCCEKCATEVEEKN